MSPGVGTLRVFPSIWGRKYCLPLEHRCMGLTLKQIGLAALETAKLM
jgi:hypothetical protein